MVVQRLDRAIHGRGRRGAWRPPRRRIANAFFDATGVRMNEFPLTPARVLAALKSPKSRLR